MKDPERYLERAPEGTAAKLLASAKNDGPSDRSWQRALAAAAAASAATAVSATTTAAGSLATSGATLWLKWLGIGALAGGVCAAGATAVLDREPPKRMRALEAAPSSAPRASSEPAPMPEALAELEAQQAEASPSARAAKPRPPVPAESSSAAAPGLLSDTLARELQRVDAARRRLSSNDARGALVELDAYRTEFPSGRFGTEAALLRAEAHVALGDCAKARALAPATPSGVFGKRWQSLLERCR